MRNSMKSNQSKFNKDAGKSDTSKPEKVQSKATSGSTKNQDVGNKTVQDMSSKVKLNVKKLQDSGSKAQDVDKKVQDYNSKLKDTEQRLLETASKIQNYGKTKVKKTSYSGLPLKKLKIKAEKLGGDKETSVFHFDQPLNKTKKLGNEKEGSITSWENSTRSSRTSTSSNISEDSMDSSMLNLIAGDEISSIDDDSSSDSSMTSSSTMSSYSGSSVSSLSLSDSSSSSTIISNSIIGSHEIASRSELAHQIIENGGRVLKKPTVTVRPAMEPAKKKKKKSKPPTNLVLHRECLLQIFKHLCPSDLAKCALVCRSWARVSIDPSLWQCIDISHKTMEASILAGVVRRQPEALVLNWTDITRNQLTWLIERLPQMKELSLQGCIWVGASALKTCVCPPLKTLDLSYVAGLNDNVLRDILSPPTDSRPGFTATKSRLCSLHTLKLAGCDITDSSVKYITENLTCLCVLDVSSCCRISDAGVSHIAATTACTARTLQMLNLAGCRLVTDATLENLARCDSLTKVDLRYTPNVTAAAIAKFAVRSRHDLKVTDGKVIVKR